MTVGRDVFEVQSAWARAWGSGFRTHSSHTLGSVVSWSNWQGPASKWTLSHSVIDSGDGLGLVSRKQNKYKSNCTAGVEWPGVGEVRALCPVGSQAHEIHNRAAGGTKILTLLRDRKSVV